MPKGRGCKAKGDNYERELAKYLTDNTGLRVERAPLSGGGTIGTYSGGADLLGTPGLFVEAKRVENLNFRSALEQAERNVSNRDVDGRPIVITRRNHQATEDSHVIMRLKDFMVFWRCWLAVQGYPADPKKPDGAHDPRQSDLPF